MGAELALFRAEATKKDNAASTTSSQSAADQTAHANTNASTDSDRGNAKQMPAQQEELPKVYDDGDAALASARRGVQRERGHLPAVYHPRALERQETTVIVNSIGETETQHRDGRVDIITPSGRHYQED